MPVELHDGWEITGLQPEGVEVGLEVGRDMAACTMPAWGGKIIFTENVIDCYGTPASGCWRGGEGDSYRMIIEVAYSPEPITGCRSDGYCVTKVLDRLDRTAFFHEINRFTLPYCGVIDWYDEPPAVYEQEMNAEWRNRMGLTN